MNLLTDLIKIDGGKLLLQKNSCRYQLIKAFVFFNQAIGIHPNF